MIWDTKRVIAVAVVVGAMTQIGNGLKAASWLIGVPDAAYGGQAVAQKVDEEFKQYLAVQKASTEAIQGYIAAQQPQQAAPRTWTPVRPLPIPGEQPDEAAGHPSADSQPAEEVSDDGEVKVFRFEGRTLCCNGTVCWSWSPQTQCAQ